MSCYEHGITIQGDVNQKLEESVIEEERARLGK